jgi:hypothetical protein
VRVACGWNWPARSFIWQQQNDHGPTEIDEAVVSAIAWAAIRPPKTIDDQVILILVLLAKPLTPAKRAAGRGCQKAETDSKSSACSRDIEARKSIALRQDGRTSAVFHFPFKTPGTCRIAASTAANGFVGGHVIGRSRLEALVDGGHLGVTSSTACATGTLGLDIAGAECKQECKQGQRKEGLYCFHRGGCLSETLETHYRKDNHPDADNQYFTKKTPKQF